MKKIEICDAISELQMHLEHAETVIHLTQEGFYDNFNPKEEDGRIAIVWEFERNGILTRIASDYLFEIRKKLNELEASIHRENN